MEVYPHPHVHVELEAPCPFTVSVIARDDFVKLVLPIWRAAIGLDAFRIEQGYATHCCCTWGKNLCRLANN